jgi:hypothetical protein
MPYIKYLIIITLCLTSINNAAQNIFSSLGESAVSINHNASKEYSINFAIRSRYFLYKNDGVQYKQQQIDVYHFSTFKLNYNHKLSFGFYYRNRDLFETGNDELRFTEQFNYTKQKLGIRHGHRFRLEQRLIDAKTIFRQRYRFAVDFPLNGEKLDIGEAYLINSIEGLFSVSKTDKPETDIRVSLQIGWQINEGLKIQTGLEHRLEAFNLIAKNYLFVLTSAVLKI